METNRMMSPAARRLAAVVLAALLCLSLFWPRGGSLTAVLCGAPLASVNGRPAAQVMAVQAEQSPFTQKCRRRKFPLPAFLILFPFSPWLTAVFPSRSW